MSNNKQETVDTLYVKYQRTLELLSGALDEVDTLSVWIGGLCVLNIMDGVVSV